MPSLKPTGDFVDVILPIPLPKLYSYSVPEEFAGQIGIGKRVVVQFGKSKVYSALINAIHNKPPDNYTAKKIVSVLDSSPVVAPEQLKHWSWMASYYMCTLGEVMNAALPAGLKLTSETKLKLNPEFDADYSLLSDKEYLVIEALQLHSTLVISEVEKILNQKTVLPVLKSLIEKRAITADEKLVAKYKSRTLAYVKLSEFADEEKNLKLIFDKLEKAPKQLEMLMAFVTISKRYSDEQVEVPKNKLLENLRSVSALSQMVHKKIFEVYEKAVTRIGNEFQPPLSGNGRIKFNEYQNDAFTKIKEEFLKKEVVLIHGVTSSGKTEIYIKLIEETLSKGKQVLYLLPEIALTTQIITRLLVHFGNRTGVYHSKFSDNERVEIWNAVLNTNKDYESRNGVHYDLILGARSALFLPFTNLGLVIIDEEHENTFKQTEPAPRYHARDAAIYLAGLHKAKTLLGTATPCMESYNNAKTGKYGFAEIFNRYGDLQMPEILVVDIKLERKQKRMQSVFSTLLMDLMMEAFNKKEQVILFQNRRGFSPFLECHLCGWIPHCKNCDVTLTYHKVFNQLRCHYCGYSTAVPAACIACGDTKVQSKGFGTEKIEEDLALFFPDINIARMDLDTTRSKNAYQRIIGEFESGKIDVLIGTQMVTKGLDFDNVSVVGILNADAMLNYPDFRAYERSFQLMAQVSGRAGRKNKRGKVVIQTNQHAHYVIKNVVNNDFHLQFEQELAHREKFKYPPFIRLIGITLKHKDYKLLDKASADLVSRLRKKLGKRVLGPEYPAITRVRNLYQKKALVKLEPGVSHSKAKEIINEQISLFRAVYDFKPVRVLLDVDPL